MFRRNPFLYFLFSIFAFLLAGLAHGDSWVYRCDGDDGAVTFGDQPCGGKSEAKFLQQAAPEVGSVVVDPSVIPQRAKSKPRAARSKASAPKVSDSRCHAKETRLERINAELRHGYRPQRGERLKRERREVEDFLDDFCG